MATETNGLNNGDGYDDTFKYPTTKKPSSSTKTTTKKKSKTQEAKDKADKESKDKADKTKNKAPTTSDNVYNMVGIALQGRTSAEIVRDVIKIFITQAAASEAKKDKGDKAMGRLLYDYSMNGATDHRKVKDLLQILIPDDFVYYMKSGFNTNTLYNPDNGYYGKVFNPDEAMDPQGKDKYLAYNGSILSFVKDLSNKPFNEIFWTHQDNKAVFHYRQTPFDPEDWFNLNYVQIDSEDVLQLSLDVTDQEQYSVFKLTSSNSISSPFTLGKPVTDDKEELEGRYGYRTMEVQSEYFNNEIKEDRVNDDGETLTNDDKRKLQEEQKSAADDENQAKLFYPSYQTVNSYPEAAKIYKNNIGTGSNSESGSTPSEDKDDDGSNTTTTTSNTKDADEDQSAIDKFYKDTNYQIDNFYGGEDLFNGIQAKLKDIYKANDQEGILDALQKYVQAFCDEKGIPVPMSQVDLMKLINIYQAKQTITKAQYIQTVLPDQEDPFSPSNLGFGSLSGKLEDADGRKDDPVNAAADIVVLSKGRIGTEQAFQIVLAMNNGTWSPETYNYIMTHFTHAMVNAKVAAAEGLQSAASTYMQYQMKLFNWYADNSKFYSGSITTPGRIDIEYGMRLYYEDLDSGTFWEFYVEGVSHDFSYTSGWTTEIDVTRGLQIESIGDRKRFEMFWNHGKEFQGGFFGEPTLDQQIASLPSKSSSSGSDDDASGSNKSGSEIAMAAVKEAKKFADKDGDVYNQGMHGVDIYTQSEPIQSDCSGFITYIFKHVGFKWDVVPSNTWDMLKAKNLTTICREANKDDAYGKLAVGDILEMHHENHVVIYIGNGKCIGWNGPSNNNIYGSSGPTDGATTFTLKDGGDWWAGWDGTILRAK